MLSFRVASAITFFGLQSNVEWWHSLNKISIIIIVNIIIIIIITEC